MAMWYGDESGKAKKVAILGMPGPKGDPGPGSMINAEATKEDSVVKITGAEGINVVIFLAPSDFSSADTYTYNGNPITLTDLNNEPVFNGWKQGSPVTFVINGDRAFISGISSNSDSKPNSFLNFSVNAGPDNMPSLNGPRFIAYGNGIFLGVNYNGKSFISKDGITWDAKVIVDNEGKIHNPDYIWFLNGYFYAVDLWANEYIEDSNPHTVLKTVDGINWESFHLVIPQLSDIKYDRYNGPSEYGSYVSDDGIFVSCINISAEIYKSLGGDPETVFYDKIIVSTRDFIDWDIARNTTEYPDIQPFKLLYKNGEFKCIAAFTKERTLQGVLASKDGLNWYTKGSAQLENATVYQYIAETDSGIIVAVPSSNSIHDGKLGYLYSDDGGSTISYKTTPSLLSETFSNYVLASSSNLIVVITFSGTNNINVILKTNNGIDWEKHKFPVGFAGEAQLKYVNGWFILSASYQDISVLSRNFEIDSSENRILDGYIMGDIKVRGVVRSRTGVALTKGSVADTGQVSIGIGNSTVSGNLLVAGNGSSDRSTLSNAFRVQKDGNVYCSGQYATSGADYAEMFEWEDGNPNSEDRRGLVVTLVEDKIRIASSKDDYILGVISSSPAILGDTNDDQWHDMYLTDIFGSPIKEYYDEIEYDELGNVVNTIRTFKLKLNPEYDPSKHYIPRSERKEWGMVGMIGKLIAIDDGSCIGNQYAKVIDGKLTHSEEPTKIKIMKRV